MTLVRTLHGDTLHRDLKRAYAVLATALLQHRGGCCVNFDGADVVALDAAVCATEQPVNLRPVRAECDLISTDGERPGEIFNNLGHMFVLSQAIAILQERCSLVSRMCAPTQQSGHEGQRIADLQGDGWVLEAFGGLDVSNNGKLAKDLRTLSVCRIAVSRTFLATREVAWPSLRSLNEGQSRQISARCSRSHGGPFRAGASVRVRGRLNGVVVLEADDVVVREET
jgi:hypothetical protein